MCCTRGAFILARTLRDVEPLLVAGRTLGRPYRGVSLREPVALSR